MKDSAGHISGFEKLNFSTRRPIGFTWLSKRGRPESPFSFQGANTVKITYDKAADALYIGLLQGDFECRTVRLTDDIALDLSVGERLVGIEVLGASRFFDTPESPKIDRKDLIPRIGPA